MRTTVGNDAVQRSLGKVDAARRASRSRLAAWPFEEKEEEEEEEEEWWGIEVLSVVGEVDVAIAGSSLRCRSADHGAISFQAGMLGRRAAFDTLP